MLESRAQRTVLGGMVAVALLLALGIRPRLERAGELAEEAERRARPRRMVVVRAEAAPASGELVLPGTLEPRQRTTLYARAPGFVRSLHADIGDVVEAGRLLVVIDAPELLEERRRALARRREAEENVRLARVAAERETRLATEGASSRQRADEATAALNSAVAAVESARADLARLESLVAYQRVTAPFAGTIVKRSVDVGALVTGGSGVGVTSLFELADLSSLRVLVDVPQRGAEGLALGTPAWVLPPGRAGAGVEGRVVRTAGALDPASRTLRVEVEAPSAPGLVAGAYVRVRFEQTRAAPTTRVPATALIVAKDGLQVAVVGTSSTVELRLAEIELDLGKSIDLLAGAAPGERVVAFPPDDLASGERVEPVERGADGAR